MALTREQITKYRLPTRPTKVEGNTHARNFSDVESVELDAMEPTNPEVLLQTAIERHIDDQALKVMLEAERSERAILASLAKILGVNVMNLDVNAVSELRARLWSAGYRPVPVFNANHTGINSPGKQPLGDKWQLHARMDPPFCVTSHAVPNALNTGVLADGLRPLDLDIDNPEKARECRAVANRMFGAIPTRSRCDTARVLLLCRAAEGEPVKRTLTGRSHTTEHSCKIEVLGRGQQFVAFGRHPSGADLEWIRTARVSCNMTNCQKSPRMIFRLSLKRVHRSSMARAKPAERPRS